VHNRLYPDFFNDVFGPIMQPGSSGGLAGPCRIGNVARSLIKSAPRAVRFELDSRDGGAAGLVNFHSDLGYLGGVQGFLPDDVRLFDAHALAREKGISYDFDFRPDTGHPGSVLIEMRGDSGETGTLVAASVGGGMIRTSRINGFAVEWQADTYGVLADGADAGRVAEFEKRHAADHVQTLRCYKEDGGEGWFIALSRHPGLRETEAFFGGAEVRVLPALLPVVTTRHKRPQLFRTIEEWRRIAEELNISFAQAAVEYEKASSGWDDARIWSYFENIADILDGQVHALERVGYENAADTPDLPIYGRLWNRCLQAGGGLSDALTRHILAHAFSTNAKLPGVRIVPGPMGAGGGYLFSALDAVREEKGFSRERLIEALAVAAGLGALAYTHTNASGEVGCVGESGVCCAMASGAVVWLTGGDGRQVERAASMALQANIGIPCDPIPGGLEFPCITRTLRAAVTAPLYAELALCGMDPLIPYHEMLQEMERNFRETDPARLCGPHCGCNGTPAAALLRQALEQRVGAGLHHRADGAEKAPGR